jgi:hypothetical protein
MEKRNVAEFTDLLKYAVEIGYQWNDAHDILINDRVHPLEESHSFIDEEDFEFSEWSEDSVKIVKGFMEKHGVTEFMLLT